MTQMTIQTYLPPTSSKHTSTQSCVKINTNESGQYEQLGIGEFSDVYKGTFKSNLAVAIKRIRHNNIPVIKQTVQNEIDIYDLIKKNKHPTFLQIIDVENYGGYSDIIMELCDGGELYSEVEKDPLSEKHSRLLMLDLLLATQHLHKLDIIHRDFKLENILIVKKPDATLDKYEIRIVDFGLAIIVDSHKKITSECGTPFYVAPEVFTPRKNGYNYKCDIWSLGVIMYIMLSGIPPFYAESNYDVLIKSRTQEVDFPPDYFTNVSQDAIELIKLMLIKNPSDRPEIETLLKHEFFSGMVDHI